RRAALIEAHLAGAVDARDGLLNQVDAVVAKHLAGTDSLGFIPVLIHIDAHAGALTQRFLDGYDVLEVRAYLVGTDLQLEDAVTADVEHLLGFGDVLGGVAGRQGPGDFQAASYTPAEQFADRQPEALALRIEQRAFQAGLGKGVALGGLVQALHGGVDIARLLADQQRAEIIIDSGLDAFRTFIAIGQTANGGGLANAFEAIAATHTYDHQRLLLHGVHRQLVRADGRQVDDDRLDAFDQGVAHSGSRSTG